MKKRFRIICYAKYLSSDQPRVPEINITIFITFSEIPDFKQHTLYNSNDKNQIECIFYFLVN